MVWTQDWQSSTMQLLIHVLYRNFFDQDTDEFGFDDREEAGEAEEAEEAVESIC